MTAISTRAASGFSPEAEALLKQVATDLLEVADPLADEMARLLHQHIPELGGFGAPAGLAQTRLSCWVNITELLVMLRAGIPPTAHETPSDALDYARFLHARGV